MRQKVERAIRDDGTGTDETIADFCRVLPSEVAAIRTRLVAGRLLGSDGFRGRWMLNPDMDGAGIEFTMDSMVATGSLARSVDGDGEPKYKITAQGEIDAKNLLRRVSR